MLSSSCPAHLHLPLRERETEPETEPETERERERETEREGERVRERQTERQRNREKERETMGPVGGDGGPHLFAEKRRIEKDKKGEFQIRDH